MELRLLGIEMNWWKRLRVRMPSLVLHHFGIDDLALRELQPMVERLAVELGAELRLALHGGDVVLVDANVARTVSAQMLQSFCEDRPLITLQREPAAPGQVRGAISYEGLRGFLQDLLQRPESAPARTSGKGDALSEWPRWQPEFDDVDSGFDSSFDSRYPGEALLDAPTSDRSAEFLRALHEGKIDPQSMPLVASYGEGAMMVFDFARGRVLLEPAALSELRVGRRLPRLDAEASPGSGMQVRDLDFVLWDLGWAAGACPLHEAPADWWHTELVPVDMAAAARYSAAPLHREMAALVARGGVTPSRLRRECRASLREVRSFLQASLFLSLVYFKSSPDSSAMPLAGAQESA